jgi:hypothetical protein
VFDMAVMTRAQSPADWRGDRLAGSPLWRIAIGDAHAAQLLATVAAVQAAGTPLADISPRSAPLPGLRPMLDRLASELMDGRGFGLLTGVPVGGLGERGHDILALVVACHLGDIVPQNAAGAPLLHVRDEGADPTTPTTRSYQHSGRLGYHADPNDIVALLCIRPARSGGLSSIISAVAVHNEILRTRPDLLEVLYQPWWYDARSGDGQDSFYQRPIYQRDARGRLTTFYGPDYIRSAQRRAHVPRLSPRQLEAMEVLDRLHNDPRFALTMDLRPGDMQFLSNRVVMHSRSAYRDHPEPERRRDLIRLWLDAAH